MTALGPTESNTFAALRSFLRAFLPADVEVVTAVGNRVAEPRSRRFVVMTSTNSTRLRTNVDSTEDVRFTGSIAGTVMTVTAVDFGTIEAGATVFGVGVAAPTTITSLASGSGGVGTYNVAPSQTVSSRVLSSGAESLEQGSQEEVQLDFHSDDSTAADLAQTVSTLMRDDAGTQQFAGQSPNYGVAPLYADDSRYMPFVNEAQQYEWRWVVKAMLQVNAVVSVPQQFADTIAVNVQSVDAQFGP